MKEEPVVRDDADKVLDAWLAAWHNYVSGYRLAAGHRATSSTTQDYQTPTHHDWWNGAADGLAERETLKRIGELIQLMPDEPHRWRTAIQIEARNLASGVTVWYSPRMPATRAERDVLILEARTRLLASLIKEMVI